MHDANGGECRLDSLTGLPGGGACREFIETHAGEWAMVIGVDICRFLLFNDIFGFDAGDAALADLARRLKTALNGRAEVFRWGGDDFYVVSLTPTGDGLRQLVAEAVCGLSAPDGSAMDVAVGEAVGPLSPDLLEAAEPMDKGWGSPR